MNALDELENKPYDDRTSLEKAIVSSRFNRDFNICAAAELVQLRAKLAAKDAKLEIADRIVSLLKEWQNNGWLDDVRINVRIDDYEQAGKK
jgi:hypothetical protein